MKASENKAPVVLSAVAQAEWDRLCDPVALARQGQIYALMEMQFCSKPGNKILWYEKAWPHAVERGIRSGIDWFLGQDGREQRIGAEIVNGREDRGIAESRRGKEEAKRELKRYACDSTHTLQFAKTEFATRLVEHLAFLERRYIHDDGIVDQIPRSHAKAKEMLSRDRVETEFGLNNLCPGL